MFRRSRIERLVIRGKDEALAKMCVDHKQAVRLKALEGMAQLGGDKCFERAAVCLSDPDPAIRCAAAQALAQINAEKGRQAIAGQLREERDPQVRHALREVMAQIAE